ncbi:MAG: Ldh family oxidoreductase, partial [Chloroflexota bacterium]
MLEQFRVSSEEAVFVQADDLRSTVASIFEKMGVAPDDARLGADVLVLADLRGVDTHGVSNMLRSYVNGYHSGEINPRPNWRIIRETPSTANIDSDRGLGIIITPKAMEIAIRKAKSVGVGMVTVGNARHLGMASYHAMLALEHDMIGVCMTSCPPLVVPTFGAEARLGTNPIAVAVPAKDEPPFVFDAATSTVAGNKIGIARRLGAKLEPGWLADAAGTPIMEEIDAPEKYTLLPLGSTRELGSHKGYGLSCVVDILAGVLTGFGYGAVPGRPNFGHYVAAYSIEAFTDVEGFKEQMDEWLRMMKSTKPAPGHDRVLVAGQPEAE